MRIRTWSLCVLIGSLLTGCGGKAPPLPTVPVKMKVTISGKPVEGNVNLRLLPEPPNGKVSVVVGKKLSDGSFALETFSPGDGAPPGTYKVEFGPVDTTDLSATVPKVKPATVIIPNDGGEVALSLEGTGGKAPQQSLLPPP